MTDATATSIHPKIKRRYAEVKKESGRKRLRILTTFLILLALVAVAGLILISPITDIDRIKIHGAPDSLLNRVKSASKIHKGEPMMFVRAKVVAANVEKVPEILTARAQVHWPHEVELFVTLRNPVIVINVNNKFIPVGADGVVLNKVDKKPANVVQITGAPTAPKAGKVAKGEVLGAAQLVNGLRADTRNRISSLTIDQGQITLTVRLNNKGSFVTFRAGTPTDMDAKAVVIDTMLANVKFSGGDVADVTSPQAPLVTPFGTTTPTSTPSTAPTITP